MLWPRGIGLDCAFMGLTFLKVGVGDHHAVYISA